MLPTVLEVHTFWQAFSVSTLELMLKGLLIGILVSAPMGPVGILIVNRTMQKGRRYGLVTGAGAAMSDIIYALFTGLGMSFAMDFVNNEQNVFVMKLIGSALLMVFGIYMFRADPTRGFRPSQNKGKGTLFHNFITGFLLTFSNPLIIFLFTAGFALLTFVVPEHIFEMCVGYLSILAGALLWWLGLTYLVDRLRKSFSMRRVRLMNHTIGIIVMIVSVGYAMLTLFHLSLY